MAMKVKSSRLMFTYFRAGFIEFLVIFNTDGEGVVIVSGNWPKMKIVNF